MLVDPKRNKLRWQTYEAQIEYYKLGCSVRTLERSLMKWTHGGRRYKAAYVQKQLNSNQLQQRTNYALKYKTEPEDPHQLDFWKTVVFTDEAHVDPSARGSSYVLRELGTRTAPENMTVCPHLAGNKLHFAS